MPGIVICSGSGKKSDISRFGSVELSWLSRSSWECEGKNEELEVCVCVCVCVSKVTDWCWRDSSKKEMEELSIWRDHRLLWGWERKETTVKLASSITFSVCDREDNIERTAFTGRSSSLCVLTISKSFFCTYIGIWSLRLKNKSFFLNCCFLSCLLIESRRCCNKSHFNWQTSTTSYICKGPVNKMWLNNVKNING